MPVQTKRKPLRVGFDLDGVLLYNPFCSLRPVTHALSHLRTKSKSPSFYVPKHALTKFVWKLIHYTSIYPAVSMDSFHEFCNKNGIESYVVTARFRCLEGLFERWKAKYHADAVFKACFQNLRDEQPHLFKAQKINELQLDYYVEDNWSIVQHLNSHTKAKIFWVANPLDKSLISYSHRFDDLQSALEAIVRDSSHV
ncbi:MAG: hypothetical protein WCJ70_00865 [bacterium]